MHTLPELLRWRARRHPDLLALQDATTRISYGELDRHTTELANGLIRMGVQPGDRVALLDKNSAAYFELMLALGKAGAVAAPVNWRLAPREVRTVVDDAQAVLCVAGEEFAAHADGTTAPVAGFAELPRDEGPDPRRDVDPAEVAWQLYTSGTTGVPKGAMLTHDNMYAGFPGILLEAPEMAEGTRTLVAMPMYHIGGCGWAGAAMYAGTTLVIEREVLPERLLRTLSEERVAAAFLVPAVLLFLSQLPEASTADFSTLSRILYGASPITPELLTRCVELFANTRFTQVYGLTETTGAMATLRHEEHEGERLLSCGRANLGTDVRVVDAEGHTLPAGEVGELVIRGKQVMRGYHNRPGETAEAIRGGWFHSGDAAAIDAGGYIYIRDRIKDMIVTGGENVYPIEVESVIAEHPAVADVAVIGVPDHRWGETVKAVVVLRPGATATEQDIIDFTRPLLADFKRPTGVDFAASIPRNPTGKILKRELREPYWQGQQRRVADSGVE